MASEPEPIDPLSLLERLADAGVDFVVIGGVAGGAHGSSYPTYDLDTGTSIFSPTPSVLRRMPL